MSLFIILLNLLFPIFIAVLAENKEEINFWKKTIKKKKKKVALSKNPKENIFIGGFKWIWQEWLSVTDGELSSRTLLAVFRKWN